MLTITITATHAGTRSPRTPDWECDAWTVTLSTDTDPPRTITVDFYTGTGMRKPFPVTAGRSKVPPGAHRIGPAPYHMTKQQREWTNPGTLWAVPPTAGDVLECLCSDAASVDNTHDKWEWFTELGFEMGSPDEARRHERAYLATIEQAAQLRRFLADHYDAALYNAPDDGWSSSIAGPVTITKETPADA